MSKARRITGEPPLLEHALRAYLEGEFEAGGQALAAVLQAEPALRNPHLLMRAIRRYAGTLIQDPTVSAERSVQFVSSLLTHLPDAARDLQPFAAGELASWLLTAGYHEYSRGDLRRMRLYILSAAKRNPLLLANRGVLSLLVESWIGSRVMTAYRSVKPRGLVRTLTLLRRPRLLESYRQRHMVIKLHLGCGDNLLEGWLNCDLSPLHRGNVIHIDATEPLPFEDATVDYIFCEHLLEHLTYQQGRNLFQECHRVLKNTGALRIATPSLEFLNELYNDRTGEFDSYIRWSVDTWVGGSIYSRALVVNSFIRNWGHQFIYDWETLRRSLEGADFRHIVLCEVGQSDRPELRGLERHGHHMPAEFNLKETLVIEASRVPP